MAERADCGNLVLRDNGLEVVEAPERILVSLGLFKAADARRIDVDGDCFANSATVRYRCEKVG